MNNTEKKKRAVSRRKRHNMRNVVMMTLLCIALMAGATYAWFTLSNTSKVSNLTMTVGDVTGLQIADVKTDGSANTYGPSISIASITGKLMPATMLSSGTLQKPKYGDDGDVTGVENIESNEVLPTSTTSGYYYEKYFYLKQMGASSTAYKISFKAGSGLGTTPYKAVASLGDLGGTYVVSTKNTAEAAMAAADVRIALYTVSGSSETLAAVYEPNSDYDKTTTNKAADNRSTTTAYSSTVKQTVAGVLSGTTDLFTINGGTEQKMKLVVWLEGTDEQCVNEISADTFAAQLQFESNE